MHRTGHYGAAMIAYAPLGFVAAVLFGLELAIVGGAVAVGLSMVPDWDMRIPGVKHRGVTHTVYFAVGIGTIVGLIGFLLGAQLHLGAAIILAVFGFFTGGISIGSHIVADALTPSGVDPFMSGETISYDVARASNPVANYALFVAGGIITIAAVATAGFINPG